MTARDDYPWLARVANAPDYTENDYEARRALDEIDRLRQTAGNVRSFFDESAP